MLVEENLKKLIEEKFDSVRRFSIEINLPYTTVRSILERGVLNSKVENVIRICEGLNIDPTKLLSIAPPSRLTPESTIDTIYSKLNVDRQKIVYKCAVEQLEEQQKEKVVSLPKKQEVDTIAAHSDDRNKVITEEEKEELNRYLDSIDEKYDKKHNKNK